MAKITPAEFGSWDPNLSAMVNITYVGTNFNNGTPPNDTGCVTGFDQISFLAGVSSNLFNEFNVTVRYIAHSDHSLH